VSDITERILSAARQRRGRPVFPEATDERILTAARRLVLDDIATPVLLGDAADVERAAIAAGVDLTGIEIIDPASSPNIDDYVRAYLENRPNTKPAVAARLISRPLFFAAAMVRAGHADAMIAGAANPTARVIEAGKMALGLSPGVRTPSSFFLVTVPARGNVPARNLIFADCALNIEPGAEELADIALASAASARKLFDEPPRVALLSFSTHGSARHASAEKVARATAIARERAPDGSFDGELQADTALVESIAAAKCRRPSEVAGKANVLVFPDLSSGNIAYKLVQQLAAARAIGPFCQGFAGPLCDLSRGATVDDIVTATAFTLVLD
jgi:phosphate acetyltransferase